MDNFTRPLSTMSRTFLKTNSKTLTHQAIVRKKATGSCLLSMSVPCPSGKNIFDWILSGRIWWGRLFLL